MTRTQAEAFGARRQDCWHALYGRGFLIALNLDGGLFFRPDDRSGHVRVTDADLPLLMTEDEAAHAAADLAEAAGFYG